MKTITVKKVLENPAEQDKRWIGKPPTGFDAEIYRGKESIRVLREDGSTLCFLAKGVMPKGLTADYYRAIAKTGAIQETSNRAMASGEKLVHKKKKDGTISNYTVTENGVMSSIIGFYDRYARANYCRKTAWTQKNTENWEMVTLYTKQVNEVYKKSCPKDYSEHRKIANCTSPDFMIGDSVFTTVTLNRNFRTHYHRDAGNLEEGLAAMSFMKTGRFSGGEIVFPNYRIGLKLENFDLIIFDNTEIHGNLPIVPVSKEYERITSVFFYRKGMVYCGTAEQELERAKRNKGDQIIGPTTEDLNNGQFCKED